MSNEDRSHLFHGSFVTAVLEQGALRLTVRLDQYTGQGFWRGVTTDYSVHHIHEHNILPMTAIPSRFRLHNFQRVAPFIGQALRAYPSAIIVDPSPLSPDTFARLLREGRDGKKRYNHTDPSVDEAFFKEFVDKLDFGIAESQIIIGPKDAVKTARLTGALRSMNSVVESKNEIVVSARDPLILEHLCALLTARVLSPPPLFVITDLPKDTIDSLETRYDVVFSPFADNPNKYEIR